MEGLVPMLVSEFDFELPEDRIALRPVSPRHNARQLVVKGQSFQDKIVIDMVDHLNEDDLISGSTDLITGKVKSALLMALLHMLQVNPLA